MQALLTRSRSHIRSPFGTVRELASDHILLQQASNPLNASPGTCSFAQASVSPKRYGAASTAYALLLSMHCRYGEAEDVMRQVRGFVVVHRIGMLGAPAGIL